MEHTDASNPESLHKYDFLRFKPVHLNALNYEPEEESHENWRFMHKEHHTDHSNFLFEVYKSLRPQKENIHPSRVSVFIGSKAASSMVNLFDVRSYSTGIKRDQNFVKFESTPHGNWLEIYNDGSYVLGDETKVIAEFRVYNKGRE